MAEPSCPGCGHKTVYWDFGCHTYPGRGETFMSCMPCDSAIELICGYDFENDDTSECRWNYVWGLNPKNPRFEEEQKKRPAWLEEDMPPVNDRGGLLPPAGTICCFTGTVVGKSS